MRWIVSKVKKLDCVLPERTFSVTGWGLVLLLVALFLLSPMVVGQALNSGTVAGRVTDEQGKAVPSATVMLTSKTQGRAVTVKSNAQGEFIFNSVPVATYTLRVKAATFAAYVVEELHVDADQNITVNAGLQPASTTADVTVIADSTTVDVRSATIGATIDTELVESLPVDGNNTVEMAALLPGVTSVNAPTTFTNNTSGPTYNTAGARSNQNLFLLDGTVWNNLYNNTGLNFPTPNALQEVSVLLNGYKAQYGRSAGSVFNSLTKSGTDSYHGSIWEFIQNRAFNATDRISQSNPPLVQNQFGGLVSGPVKKDRLFFLASFQDLISDAAVVAQGQTLTLNQRGVASDGISPNPCQTPAFAALGQPCASFQEDVPPPSTTPGSYYWFNPVKGYNATQDIATLNAAYTQATGNPTSAASPSPCVALLMAQPSATATSSTYPTPTLAYPEIPQVCWNPVSVALLSVTPINYSSGAYSASGLPLATTIQKQPRNDKNALIRMDWLRGRHTIDARYYFTDVNDRTANGVGSGQGVASYDVNYNTGGIQYGNVGDTWIVNGSMVNVARVGYKRYNYQVQPTTNKTTGYFGANYTQPQDTLPRIYVVGRPGYSMGSGQNIMHTVDEDFEVDDALSWTHGVHNVQVGGQFLRLQYLARYASTPNFVFNNDSQSTDPAMEYMLGILSSMNVGNSTNQGAVQHDLYLYAQDDWRIKPRLTLNLGVRYEIPFQWYQPDGQGSTFIPGYQSQVFPTAPANLAYVGDNGIERSLVGTSYNNVAPRVGFAYDLFGGGKTSIRGGFGIFYDAINALVVGVATPYHYTAQYNNPVGGLSNPLLGLPSIPANYVRGQSVFQGPYSITFPDHNFRTPYVEAVNLGVQQHVGKTSVIEANYVGRFSHHLALGYDLNPAIYDCNPAGAYYQMNPSLYCTNASESQASYQARVKYPGFNYGGAGVLDYMTEGFANYHSAQIIYRYTSSKWLTLMASYTFSKSIDDSSNGTYISNSTDQPSLSIHRAVSDFNARHVFNMGWTLHYPNFRHSFFPGERTIVNGWGLTGVYTARTGYPFSVIAFNDNSMHAEPNEYMSLGPYGYAPLNSHRSRESKINEWFNTAAFVAPSKGTYGNAPRNFLNGPGYILTSIGLQRIFPMNWYGSKSSMFFRADAFNVFNCPNLGQPYSYYSGVASKNGNYGRIINTVGANGAVGTNGRRLQVSATIRF